MKVALHICCAVCAAGAAERLIQESHEVIGFFYNPNIFPEAEYQRRLASSREVARQLRFPLVEGLYEPALWRQVVASLEAEPEGGKRCLRCFEMRLERTWRFMAETGCTAFTTTLTMGSNKSEAVIAAIGRKTGGDAFLSRDFKKRDGFKRASELARQWGLYRQHYCGCEYSLKKP